MGLFGPSSPSSISSLLRTWGLWVIGIFLFGLGGVVLGAYLVYRPAALNQSKTVVTVTEPRHAAVTSSPLRYGGDIEVPIPFTFPPILPVLTGTLLREETFTAHSILVKDTNTGMLLYKKEPYATVPIASLTKLMSALVIIEQSPDWSKTVTVESADLFDTHVLSYKTYTLEELWHAALIGSSNRAIATIAEHVGYAPEAFIMRMNEKARELGMTKTNFLEPSGLEAENYSTASDILILLNEALRVPRIQETLLLSEYELQAVNEKKSTHIWNTNWLLLGWVPHMLPHIFGGKTGYIPESGYNFVVRVEDEAGHSIDVAVLGAETHEARFIEARDIAMWTFENYTWPDELGGETRVRRVEKR